MRGASATLLGLEAIVALLAALTAVTTTDVAPGLAWAAGGGLAVLCVLAAGLLRKPAGQVLGSVVQVLAIASGFLVPTMFFLGALFAGLWVLALVLGRRIEAVQAQRAAVQVQRAAP